MSCEGAHVKEGPIVPTGLLPSYLAEIFGELYAEDGLVVLGKGLQSEMLLAAFVRFYSDTEEGHWAAVQQEETKKRVADPPTKSTTKRPPLVLVLGLQRETERATLLDILTSWGTPPNLLPTILTNESGQSKERASLYSRGGVFCITSRILIVDLLTNVVDSNQIDGLLVAHAEKVTETSTEAFILRIIQSQRHISSTASKPAFVKAISDAPAQLMSGFAKVDKILKALHVRRLYLYPRFQDSIREELEGRNPPHVTELHQQLSPLQKEMQQAIAVAVQSCIREIKASTPLVEWSSSTDDQQLSVENIVSSQLDRSISRQLEQDWHRLTPKTKQLVQDLRTLRTLFQSLLLYDCVSFYKLLHSLKSLSATSRQPSLWLLTPAADHLFRKAKERVYTIHKPAPTAKVPAPVARCQPVLEENPKWRLLRQVLTEIQQAYDKQQEKTQDNNKGPSHILVMVKDDRTLETVKDYLVQGKRTLLLRWLRHLEQFNDRSRSITDSKGGTAAISEESRLLLEEEGRARRILFGRNNTNNSPKKRAPAINHIPQHVRKRRRIAAEKGRGELTHQADDLEREAVLLEAVDATEQDMQVQLDDDTLDPFDGRFTVSFPTELRVVLKCYTSVGGDQATLLLQDLNPSHVLFYDTDVGFVRSVEIHAALSTAPDPIQVYFLMFEASSEEKTFLKSLEREQNAFERLIHHKKSMPPPALHGPTMTQEMQHAFSQGSVGGSYMGGNLPLSVDTRSGQGKANTFKQRRDIAVDVREFRSALPSILHQGGMRLAPVTLIVGDFVLSSVHCVERKSISDLFGSFASGRLYTQAEAMVKHYKAPCLLIEFDPAKSFCLQNANELGVEIRTDSVCSKMALLTMHFPQLRLLWSRSPHETLRIFRELKKNHDEVDVEKAAEIGRNESEEELLRPEDKDGEEDEINETARDMLLRLPGVNVHSARMIMENCDSLAELSEMSRDELRKIAGPVTGQKLFTFFRQKITPAGV
jgi:DNA excision repair protein ERCC-4